MEIEYKLTEADILALMQYRLRRLPNLKNPVLVRRFTYMGGFMGLSIGSLILFNNIVLAMVFIVLAISSFLLYPAYFNWILRRKVRATYRDEKNRKTLASRILRATDEGLEEKSDFGEIKLKWELVDAINTTSTYIFITIQGIPSMIIPRQRVTMGNDEDFLDACQLHIKVNFT